MERSGYENLRLFRGRILEKTVQKFEMTLPTIMTLSNVSIKTEPSAGEPKAVALFSGGLDSVLAVYLVKSQGIDVTAIHFTSFFSQTDPADANSPVNVCARSLDIPLVFLPKGPDFIELIRNPRYGHGKNINPCIDCRIYTFKKARAFMESIGASFIVTGEVVGQRPMSQQRNTLRLIERRAGCEGIILRPLSAKKLPSTACEESGIIDRDKLLDIAGRGRKIQLGLARSLKLSGYAAPAGGCLLTDKNFSRRLRDLLEDKSEISLEELELLRIGRHLRIRPGLKIVVGRDEKENLRMDANDSVAVKFEPDDFPGPMVAACEKPSQEEERLIGGVLLRYTKPAYRGNRIIVIDRQNGSRYIDDLPVVDDHWIEEHII